MRIYEFAQLNNLSSKDIIEKLQKNGFDVKSHMSVLDDKALSFLKKETQQIPANIQATESVKESKPAHPIENKVAQLSQQATVRTSSSSKASADKKSKAQKKPTRTP